MRQRHELIGFFARLGQHFRVFVGEHSRCIEPKTWLLPTGGIFHYQFRVAESSVPLRVGSSISIG